MLPHFSIHPFSAGSLAGQIHSTFTRAKVHLSLFTTPHCGCLVTHAIGLEARNPLVRLSQPPIGSSTLTTTFVEENMASFSFTIVMLGDIVSLVIGFNGQ